MSQHSTREEGSMRLLPDDVLADVLRRVAPRGVATSRRVCRAWRALIDDRRLLRGDLLPRSLAGLFVNYHELPFADLFHRRSADLTGYYMPCTRVWDHCNGVLLLHNALLNPAAQWWATLPEPPRRCCGGAGMEHFNHEKYLVFDPAESPHCQVLLIPRTPCMRVEISAAVLESEWPPSPCTMNVFSTVTGQWAERSFGREGEAAGTVADMLKYQGWLERRHAVCWRGALYVHCENDFVMRISLSKDTYRMIPPPVPHCIEMYEYAEFLLGRSEKGVYCALIDDEAQLRVWILDESCSRMEWVLKHDSGCGLAAAQPSLNYFAHQVSNGPWILQNANRREGDNIVEAPIEQESEWDSDDEDVLNNQDSRVENHQYRSFGILGFHPYKEIVFLNISLSRGLAYHLNTSKLESLGNMCPIHYYNRALDPFIESNFPYTPCTMGGFPGSCSS